MIVDGQQVGSGTSVAVNASSFTFEAGSTSGTTGKLFVKSIQVIYIAA